MEVSLRLPDLLSCTVLGLPHLKLPGMTHAAILACSASLPEVSLLLLTHVWHFSAKTECVFKLMYFDLNRCWSVSYEMTLVFVFNTVLSGPL